MNVFDFKKKVNTLEVKIRNKRKIEQRIADYNKVISYGSICIGASEPGFGHSDALMSIDITAGDIRLLLSSEQARLGIIAESLKMIRNAF